MRDTPETHLAPQLKEQVYDKGPSSKNQEVQVVLESRVDVPTPVWETHSK